MGSLNWRGKTSKRIYSFMQQTIPPALLSPYGQPLLEGVFNGEIVVSANHDGSVAEPVATGPPPGASLLPTPIGASGNSIYDCYTQAGLWETEP